LLVDAITIFVSGKDASGGDMLGSWEEARNWIFGNESDCASFLTACTELELQPDRVRQRVQNMLPGDLTDLRRMCES
jgi:hypothetical protein